MVKEFVVFDAAGDKCRQARMRAAMACAAYNNMAEDASEEQRIRLWCNISGRDPTSLESPSSFDRCQWKVPYVKGPFRVDYGTNLHIGRTTFINRGCTILDTAASRIVIGDDCSIGPNVSIYGVTHPKDRRCERGPLNSTSLAADVVIGDNCWIAGGVTILPGVTLGEGCVIGARAVVTKDVPAYHVAVGVPARVRGTVAPDIPLQIASRDAAPAANVDEFTPYGSHEYVAANAQDEIMAQANGSRGKSRAGHQNGSAIPGPLPPMAVPLSRVPKRLREFIAPCQPQAKRDIAIFILCCVNFVVAMAALIHCRSND